MNYLRVRVDELVSCMGYLRYSLHWVPLRDLEPFHVDTRDALSVNSAVKRIAEHGGLSGLRFIVSIGNLEPESGGQIELRSGQEEVFIDVCTSAGAFGPSLIAVLAHEVSHKVLFDHRILRQDDNVLAYEVLTDVAAVYLGYGKLLLNGYRYSSRKTTGRRVERRSYRFGYLSVEEVAFVQAMASRMRPHQNLVSHAGLSRFASSTLGRIEGEPAFAAHFSNAKLIAPRREYRQLDNY